MGQRVVRLLHGRWRIRALTSSPERAPALRALGATPIFGNLDHRATLLRCRALGGHALHLAPPPPQGATDPRTHHLLSILASRPTTHTLVYVSTTGVYGPGGPTPFDESHPAQAQTPRAQRRVHAEHLLRHGSGPKPTQTLHTTILRAPGIYGLDRSGGSPLERLQKGLPVLQQNDDVFTNHIHADDLARACCTALWRGANRRTYNVCDHSDMKMGDYFDLAADLAGRPRPTRITREQARQTLSPMQMSFLSESRRLLNHRLTRELRLQLRYPTVREGLAGLKALSGDAAERAADRASSGS